MALRFLLAFVLLAAALPAQSHSPQQAAITQQLRKLRQLPDDARSTATMQLALDIRKLSPAENKTNLATQLANLATEGDFGRDTLQAVATTLEEALRERPFPPGQREPAGAYVELAALVRYEHLTVSLDDSQFKAAMAKLEAEDERRRNADFTLTDLEGKSWTLSALRGKVVLVNIWATWCPPCRKEMPDFETLYKRFSDQGLVILAISDEDAAKVNPSVAERHFSYPILLDPGRKVNKLYLIQGIPKSFVYGRDGKLVAQAMDMRTEKQLLEMLAKAGLR